MAVRDLHELNLTYERMRELAMMIIVEQQDAEKIVQQSNSENDRHLRDSRQLVAGHYLWQSGKANEKANT
ncbi:unnamed protein product [Arctia plantaginis]|uniref:Uncharacterized protein n=1 Tax=Arctia plantaginis TaxID=874455 RepID=A0A8S0ZBB8_ARCPL|nr:unnamed protein product [Arctia plantaginis]